LASVNLWELPTYALLGVAALLVSQFRSRRGIHWGATVLAAVGYVAGAYLAYLPFFRHYANVGASGIGLVTTPDAPRFWLLVWGFLLFIVVSWLLYAVSRPARPALAADGSLLRPTGVERLLSLVWRRFDRLPRLVYLHRRLVRRSTLGYQMGLWLLPLSLLLAAGALLWRSGPDDAPHTVLALCLPLLALAFLLLWRRGRAADPGAQFATLLMAIGLAILAGTQVVYLKDFLQGGDWRRMNTLFKFFIQVWVIWGVAAGVAAPRLWRGAFARRTMEDEGRTTNVDGRRTEDERPTTEDERPTTDGDGRWSFVVGPSSSVLRPSSLTYLWRAAFLLLLVASLAYPVFGTPARLKQRLFGWKPPFGTLNGQAYMEQGVYTWPDESNLIELRYDWEAIRWLLENVRGNPVIVESSELDYYRAGGTRIASHTGISGLNGMHESEQRYGDEVGQRSALHNEFWSTPDVERTRQIMDELGVNLIYAGQLEEQVNPDGVAKLAQMAADGYLTPIYANDRVTIYLVNETMAQDEEGVWTPQ
jgi:uncharacterized membrane protein